MFLLEQRSKISSLSSLNDISLLREIRFFEENSFSSLISVRLATSGSNYVIFKMQLRRFVSVEYKKDTLHFILLLLRVRNTVFKKFF